MTTAFVLWGGGSLGAAQVGMLDALAAHGVRPDLVVGASVGALNGTYFAARPDRKGAKELIRLWLRVGEHDVFPLSSAEVARVLSASLPGRPVRGLLRAIGALNYAFPVNLLTVGLAAIGRRNHLFDNSRFERFLRDVLPLRNLEDAEIPVHVLCTEVLQGQSVLLSKGPALRVLLASTAIPGFYPPVEIDGRLLMDGSVSNRTTLDHAVELGADEVYLLSPGFSCHLPHPPTTVLSMALHAYNLLAEQRMAASISHLAAPVRLHTLPPLCPIDVLPIDFRQTARMIAQARESTAYWLENDHRGQPGTTRSLGDFHQATR